MRIYPSRTVSLKYSIPKKGDCPLFFKPFSTAFSIQIMNLNITQAMISMIAEYFRPATTLPSPIWPATRPEQTPWIIAACEKSRV